MNIELRDEGEVYDMAQRQEEGDGVGIASPSHDSTEELKQFLDNGTSQANDEMQVISDPKKRGIYDQFGEEGLEGQVPLPDVGAPLRTIYSHTGEGASYVDCIFAELFGFSTPYDWMGGGGLGGMRGSSWLDNLFRGCIFSAPSIEITLPCSLEELYEGTTKKMKISQQIAHASG
ncbi:hypothetical protein Ancab_005324 [Ancistrocladus abbreviatus]